MNGVRASGVARGDSEGVAATSAIAGWLHLAAAPTFAIMALSTLVLDSGQPNVFCSTADGLWLGGMTPMYVLMAVFHSAPWLKLVSRSEKPLRLF